MLILKERKNLFNKAKKKVQQGLPPNDAGQIKAWKVGCTSRSGSWLLTESMGGYYHYVCAGRMAGLSPRWELDAALRLITPLRSSLPGRGDIFPRTTVFVGQPRLHRVCPQFQRELGGGDNQNLTFFRNFSCLSFDIILREGARND